MTAVPLLIRMRLTRYDRMEPLVCTPHRQVPSSEVDLTKLSTGFRRICRYVFWRRTTFAPVKLFWHATLELHLLRGFCESLALTGIYAEVALQQEGNSPAS